MKKFLMTILLIFIILLIFLSSINYAATITEQTLENALSSLKQSEILTSNSEILMDKTNKKIKITTQETNNILTYNINYNLSSEPTFTLETTIDNSTTYDQWSKKQAELLAPATIYIPIASINGVSEKDSLLYITSEIIFENAKNISSLSYKIEETDDTVKITNKDGSNIPVSEFPKHAIAIAKDYYNKDIVVTDSDGANTFNFITKIKDSSENSCTLQTVFTINSNGDFSKISGYTDNALNELSNSIISSSKNFVDKYKNMAIQEQELLNKYNELINNVNKLPQTGDFFELKDTLILISIASSFLLVIIILKDIKYKNINNK